MEKLKSIQINNYKVRNRVYQGNRYLVVPVVMMVEGVHNGSHGAIFHTAEELEASTSDWNGVAVTVHHPQNSQGEYISVNDEGGQSSVVGEIRNARWEDNKLKGDVWLNAQKLVAQSPMAFQHIQGGVPLEVSIGVFTHEEAIEGNWNGETYEAIARNYDPDHLALLPGDQGACNWEDGCGVRVNVNYKGGKKNAMKVHEMLKKVNESGYAVSLINNETGYSQLMEKVRRKLDSLDSDLRTYYLEEVFEDYLIYAVSRRDSNERTLHRQNYRITDDEQVEFTGDPVEVRKDVNYVTIATSRMTRRKTPNSNETQKKEEQIMTEKKETPCCLEKVVDLINNKQTQFTSKDKEWLLALEEDRLDKLFPKDPEPVQVNREQALEVLKDTLTDPEKLVEILSGDVKEKVQAGLNLHKEERENLIKSIQTNAPEGTWEEKDLAEMDTAMLQKVAKSVEREGDYSGQASSTVNTTGGAEVEPLYPAGIEIENK